MFKKSEEANRIRHFNMLPAVVDLYQQRKEAWAKEGLSSQQQLKTAHYINDVLGLIYFAIKNNHQNTLDEVLEKHAKRFFNSPIERIRIFGSVQSLLRQGDMALQKISWYFANYSEAYEEKFMLNSAGLKFDKIRQFLNKEAVPEYSFIPFSKGENPAFSYHPKVWEKVLISEDYKNPEDIKSYHRWITQTKMGKRYAQNQSLCEDIVKLFLLQAHDYLSIEEKTKRLHKTR